MRSPCPSAMVLALAVFGCSPAGRAEEPAPPVAAGIASPEAPATAPPTPVAPAPSTRADLRRVRQVIDGDTLTVSGIGAVRLIGVDAPEKRGGYREAEPYGDQATAYLKKLAEGQLVRLEYDGERRDRYSRTLAYVFLESGTLVNEEMIRAGWAEHYRNFDYRRKGNFQRAEREARAARRGMWAGATSRRPR
ncbi:MAG: thermonuclease family protein [Vicinamibacterales bacterium]